MPAALHPCRAPSPAWARLASALPAHRRTHPRRRRPETRSGCCHRRRRRGRCPRRGGRMLHHPCNPLSSSCRPLPSQPLSQCHRVRHTTPPRHTTAHAVIAARGKLELESNNPDPQWMPPLQHVSVMGVITAVGGARSTACETPAGLPGTRAAQLRSQDPGGTAAGLCTGGQHGDCVTVASGAAWRVGRRSGAVGAGAECPGADHCQGGPGGGGGGQPPPPPPTHHARPWPTQHSAAPLPAQPTRVLTACCPLGRLHFYPYDMLPFILCGPWSAQPAWGARVVWGLLGG